MCLHEACCINTYTSNYVKALMMVYILSEFFFDSLVKARIIANYSYTLESSLNVKLLSQRLQHLLSSHLFSLHDYTNDLGLIS